jgi:hypothetical protein
MHGEAYRQKFRLLLLGFALVVTQSLAGCAQPCPHGLLDGTLVERAGELVVIGDDVSGPQVVDWSASGYEVRQDGGRLVVADSSGVKAGEGDFVSLGGGSYESGWRACGSFTTGQTGG